MDPRILSVWARTARIAAAAAAILVIAGCNLPQASPSGGESGDAGGQYESNPQALEGVSEKDFKENVTGCKDRAKWYLCIDVALKTKFYDPPGEVNYTIQPGESTCAEIVNHLSETSRFSKVSKLDINGVAEDETKKCTLKGSSSVTFSGVGWCEGSPDRGAFNLTVNQKWAEGPTDIECVSKRPNGKKSSSHVVLGGLGDDTFEMTLETWKKWSFPQYQCKKFPMLGGVLSGELSYCLYQNQVYQPPPIPVSPPE